MFYSEYIHSKLYSTYTQELLVLYYIGTKHNANSIIDETQDNTEINPEPYAHAYTCTDYHTVSIYANAYTCTDYHTVSTYANAYTCIDYHMVLTYANAHTSE